MKLLMSPTVDVVENKITYKFIGEKVIVTQLGVTDEFDFSFMPEGELPIDYSTGETEVETKLKNNPIVEAKRENGELWLTLLNTISHYNATEEEKFPNWIDVKDYRAGGFDG